jgi:hypothetical protein
MKAIKINKCSDLRMWYYDHVGKIVPLVRIFEEEYLTREPSGYSNIVKMYDAELVDVDPSEITFPLSTRS